MKNSTNHYQDSFQVENWLNHWASTTRTDEPYKDLYSAVIEESSFLPAGEKKKLRVRLLNAIKKAMSNQAKKQRELAVFQTRILAQWEWYDSSSGVEKLRRDLEHYGFLKR